MEFDFFVCNSCGINSVDNEFDMCATCKSEREGLAELWAPDVWIDDDDDSDIW